jgi:hypothetical protein
LPWYSFGGRRWGFEKFLSGKGFKGDRYGAAHVFENEYMRCVFLRGEGRLHPDVSVESVKSLTLIPLVKMNVN